MPVPYQMDIDTCAMHLRCCHTLPTARQCLFVCKSKRTGSMNSSQVAYLKVLRVPLLVQSRALQEVSILHTNSSILPCSLSVKWSAPSRTCFSIQSSPIVFVPGLQLCNRYEVKSIYWRKPSRRVIYPQKTEIPPRPPFAALLVTKLPISRMFWGLVCGHMGPKWLRLLKSHAT